MSSNAYVIDTNDPLTAITELVEAYRRQNNNVGRVHVLCKDGSTVLIDLKKTAGKPRRVKR